MIACCFLVCVRVTQDGTVFQLVGLGGTFSSNVGTPEPVRGIEREQQQQSGHSSRPRQEAPAACFLPLCGPVHPQAGTCRLGWTPRQFWGPDVHCVGHRSSQLLHGTV